MSLNNVCADRNESLQQKSGDVHLEKVLKVESNTSTTFLAHNDCTVSWQKGVETELFEFEFKDIKIESSDDDFLKDESSQLFNLPSATESSSNDSAEYVPMEEFSKEPRDFTLLQCPECDKTFKGGPARIPSMIKHITIDHFRKRRKLVEAEGFMPVT